MKSGSILIKMAACAALVLGFGFNDALAQTHVKAATGGTILNISKLTGNGPRALMRCQETSGRAHSYTGGIPQWAELSVQFDTVPDWIDEVTFQFYALLKSKGSGDYTLLKGNLTYIDVARGRGHLGVAYVRPSALARYGEGGIVGVAVEALVKGEVVSTLSEGKLGAGKPLPQEWWQNKNLVPKEGYIVEKSKTPFALVNFDDYEAVK